MVQHGACDQSLFGLLAFVRTGSIAVARHNDILKVRESLAVCAPDQTLGQLSLKSELSDYSSPHAKRHVQMAGYLGLATYNWEKLIFYLWIGLIKSTFDWGLPSFAMNLGNPCCLKKKSPGKQSCTNSQKQNVGLTICLFPFCLCKSV